VALAPIVFPPDLGHRIQIFAGNQPSGLGNYYIGFITKTPRTTTQYLPFPASTLPRSIPFLLGLQIPTAFEHLTMPEFEVEVPPAYAPRYVPYVIAA
jgi:hypothetical protein